MIHKSFKIPAIAIFLLVLFCLASASENYIQTRIYIDSKADFIKVREMHLDIVWKEDNYIEVVANADQLEKIKSSGLKYKIIIEDLTAHYKSRLAKPDKPMGAYKTLSELYSHLDGLILDHSNIVSPKMSIGQTLEGRDQWAVKISDNPQVDEDEPELLYTACIHAREVITPEVLLHFMDYLTDNYGVIPEVTELVDNREMWFIIMVNPDGYYYNEVTDPGGGGMWRKNRRNNGNGTYGVDLNRNFGYEWGYDDQGSSPYGSDADYRGSAPFSEPETQNLRNFANQRNFIITMYYHSYSNLILYPWGYDSYYTEDHTIFSALGDSINSMNGYAPGTAWELLYPVNGSSDDWHYGEQVLKNKNLAMTIEVGSYSDGFWPEESRIDDLIEENLEPNLFLARIAGNLDQLYPPVRPTLVVDDTLDAGQYTINWFSRDTLNPPVKYELVEMQGYNQYITDSVYDDSNWDRLGFIITTSRYNSPPKSFYSGAANSIDRKIQFKNPLFVRPGDSLKFKAYFEIELDWDYAYVEVTTDGMNYYTLPGNITTDFDPNGNNMGNGITGSSSGWVDAAFDLSNYEGKNIFVRFRYITDSYVTEEGFYFDDIYPLEGYDSITVIASDIADTSYTFYNRDEGTYFYKVRGQDAEQQWSEFSGVRETYVLDINDFICGDVNETGTIDILDITFLINYLYKEGAAPVPYDAADVNSDMAVNLLDVTYLINHLYGSGPEPSCP